MTRKQNSKSTVARKIAELGVIILLAGLAAIGLRLATENSNVPSATSIQKNQSIQPPSLSLQQCIDNWPVSFLVGQVLAVGIPADSMTVQAPIFKHYRVGSAVLSTSPTNPNDGSIKRFKKAGGGPHDPVLISTDEEGGDVQRFSSLGVLPAPAEVASSLTPAQAKTLITNHGVKLKSVGIDMVLGPLADVAPQQTASPLGSRVFSSNPAIVTSYVGDYIQGWQAAGLLPTLKHFPGMGSATGNTDFEPATTPPLSSLKTRDFVPYTNLAITGTAVMVGNQNVPGWFKGPASLSLTVNQYLRNTLGYKNNFIVTDSLAATAITSVDTVPEAVVKALAAGNDMALIVEPSGFDVTKASTTKLISQVEAVIVKAVNNGLISKQQLATSVDRKLSAQHINACSLTKADY